MFRWEHFETKINHLVVLIETHTAFVSNSISVILITAELNILPFFFSLCMSILCYQTAPFIPGVIISWIECNETFTILQIPKLIFKESTFYRIKSFIQVRFIDTQGESISLYCKRKYIIVHSVFSIYVLSLNKTLIKCCSIKRNL